MGPALYLIAILGCGEGDAPCQEVRTVETRYESRDACLAATSAVLNRTNDVDAPNIVAQCRAAGASPEPVNAADVERPEGGVLPADARSPLRPVQ